MSTTSLSAISNLPIHALETTTLESLILGDDLKIEISKGNSQSDSATIYRSHKLNLNQLLNIIRTYIDSQINNLSTTLTDKNKQQDNDISNKADSNLIHEYLPLSGGTLTGNLYSNLDDFYIQNKSDNKKIKIQSGDTKSSSITLNANNNGSFNIECNKNDKTYKLEGTADGDLKWNGKSLVQNGITIIEANKIDNRWYRKYSDGWLEQGGVTNEYAPNNSKDIRIDFIYKYKDVPNVIASIENTYGALGNECECVIGKYNTLDNGSFTPINTDGFHVFILRKSGSSTDKGRVHWYACGYEY